VLGQVASHIAAAANQEYLHLPTSDRLQYTAFGLELQGLAVG
jgi:hypothetical protein